MQSPPIIRKKETQNISPIDSEARCPLQISISEQGWKPGLWSIKEKCITQRKYLAVIIKVKTTVV